MCKHAKTKKIAAETACYDLSYSNGSVKKQDKVRKVQATGGVQLVIGSKKTEKPKEVYVHVYSICMGALVCLKLSSLNLTVSYIMEYSSTPHVGMA